MSGTTTGRRAYLVEDEDGFEHVLPTRFEVCPTCEGHGTHDHPAFANGITGSEWAEWDGEEQEHYLRGHYDVRCEECNGDRVSLVVDEDKLSDTLKALWYAKLDDDAAYRRECEAERRMGC